jgi:hypothetical protein
VARSMTPPAGIGARATHMSRSTSLCRRAGEHPMTAREERLAGPSGREMKPESPDTPDDPSCDFEELRSDRPDRGGRQARPREDRAPEVGEQQEGEAVELQAERIRAEAMTAEAIGVDIELEFLDPILRRAPVVVPRDEIGGAAAAIGDHESDVESGRGDIDLDENPPMMGPRLRTVPKTRANVHGPPAALVAGLRLRDQRRHARFEDAIRADAEHVIDPVGFEFRFDSRRGHPGVAAQENRRMRKPSAQRRQDVPQLVDHAGRTRVATRTQPRPQQEAGAPFKPDQRMVHVLVVPAMKQRELLRPVRRIICAVEIENEIRGVLVGTIGRGTELVHAGTRETLNGRPVDRILQARQRRLRPERRATVGGDGLEARIVAQPVRIVDVFVPGRDLIQPLAEERVQFVRDVTPIARIGDPADDVGAEAELFIELADEQQPTIRRERPARKIDDEFRLESEAKLAITLYSHRTSRVGVPSRPRTPRKYHDFFEGDGISTYSFVNYPG